ncbi:MAG: hypothetical protein J6C46_08855 [Clostridia bacterium]|nr:hypothetical protein [Clostridia bacterium]
MAKYNNWNEALAYREGKLVFKELSQDEKIFMKKINEIVDNILTLVAETTDDAVYVHVNDSKCEITNFPNVNVSITSKRSRYVYFYFKNTLYDTVVDAMKKMFDEKGIPYEKAEVFNGFVINV